MTIEIWCLPDHTISTKSLRLPASVRKLLSSRNYEAQVNILPGILDLPFLVSFLFSVDRYIIRIKYPHQILQPLTDIYKSRSDYGLPN